MDDLGEQALVIRVQAGDRARPEQLEPAQVSTAQAMTAAERARPQHIPCSRDIV
jgi:hypothetical protein